MTDRQMCERRVRGAVAAALAGKVEVESLSSTADLFDAGMTSHQTVQVMLALEDEFDIEFPDDQLTRSTFETINSMVEALVKIE